MGAATGGVRAAVVPPAARVALAAFALTAGLLAGCSDDAPRRDAEGKVTEPAVDAEIGHVREGDCVGDVADADEVTTIDIVPCDDAHDQEAFAVLEVPDGEFPGDDALRDQAEDECATRFADFIGTPWERSELDVTWLQPTQESWADGDREIVCLVFNPDGPVTGTLAGAAR